MGNDHQKGIEQEGAILWMEDVVVLNDFDSLRKVGGKGKGLGDLWRLTSRSNLRVPDCFCISTAIYRKIVDKRIRTLLNEVLQSVNCDDMTNLSKTASHCRRIIYEASGDHFWLKVIIQEAYYTLCKKYDNENMDLSVAVRSSATAEDLPYSSFAGQHDTYLNIRGIEQLYEATRHCLASVFTSRALAYRESKQYPHLEVELCVCVQMMVRSDLGASGVAFTCDVDSGSDSVVLINSSWGLGEAVVQGIVDVDEYYVHSESFRKGYRTVLHHSLGKKEQLMKYNDATESSPFSFSSKNDAMQEQIHLVQTNKEQRNSFSLTDTDVLSLCQDVLFIQDEYPIDCNLDIEFAKEPNGEIFIVQCRPETVESKTRSLPYFEIFDMNTRHLKPIATGHAIGTRVGAGPVRILASNSFDGAMDGIFFSPGDVLVTDMTHPDMVPLMRRASAIVTEFGGSTCHAAIVARELGVPCIVGATCAMKTMTPYAGKKVTICCCNGSRGAVYDGEVPYQMVRTAKNEIPSSITRCAYNLGNPTLAFKSAMLHNQGCGLVRMEFVMANIGVHPMSIIHPEQLSQKQREQLLEMSDMYDTPKEWFITKLSEELGMIAAAFYPHPVNIRLSDFKTNEFSNLLGGSVFEKEEENPLMGFRGAYRYSHPSYKEGFSLECAALLRIRDEIGLDNIEIMIPFVRTIEEARDSLHLMARYGLTGQTFSKVLRESGSLRASKLTASIATDDTAIFKRPLLINMMVEVPCNCILIEDFAKLFDGFSIGTNDLTALVLGIDRDSETLIYPELNLNPALQYLIKLAISGSHHHGKKIGICGELGADPQFIRFLIFHAIDYISVNPNSILDVVRAAKDSEQHVKHLKGVEEEEEDFKHDPDANDLSIHSVYNNMA
jgi:pyruvate, water dikinase